MILGIFHCYPHELHVILGEILPCVCLFCGFGLLAGWCYYPIYISILIDKTVSYSPWQARENIFLHKKVSTYKVYLMIQMNRTSFLDCKHKHMMQSGAPSCTVWLPTEFHVFTSRINSYGYHSLVPGLT